MVRRANSPLPAAAISGENIRAPAMSEPNAGSDVVHYETAGREKSDSYLAQRHQDVDHQRPDAQCILDLRQKPNLKKARHGITAVLVEARLGSYFPRRSWISSHARSNTRN